MLRIWLLGVLRLEADGVDVEPPSSQRARLLLAILAIERRSHSREALAAQLWPGVLDESARASLRTALSQLRAAVGPQADRFIKAAREHVGLDPEQVWTDVGELERLLKEGNVQAALELWGGELLTGLKDDWVHERRDELRQRLRDALRTAAGEAEAAGDLETSLLFTRRQVALDPLAEESQRELMRRLAVGGERAAALAAYDSLATRLREQLGVGPSQATRELAAAIRAGEVPPQRGGGKSKPGQEGEGPGERGGGSSEPREEGAAASGDVADDRVEWVSDSRATADLLQRQPLARVLATRLRRLREDEPGRSFLIHVDGRWGSGKSTLLDLLGTDLAGEWLVVEFDAWRQMRVGPPWWALLASLRHAVNRDLGPLAGMRLRVAETGQHVRRGGALYVVCVTVMLALVVGIALLLGASVDLGTAGTIAKSIAAIGVGMGVLFAAMSAIGRFLLWDSAAGARVFEQSNRDPMESVADHFAWLIARAERPVMFFVDDLDRCPNSYVVDLLDSVQTLLRDAPGRIDDRADPDRACYVVVAADGRWIRTSYEHAHADFADAVEEPGRPLGYLFLDKIFQLTLPVPLMSPQRQRVYLQALLHLKQDNGQNGLASQVQSVARRVEDSTTEAEALDAFDEAPAEVRAAVAGKVVSKLAEPQIQEGTQHRLERFVGLLEPNPRAMKLVLNAYGMARALQVMEDNVVPGDALALWTILRVRWPALADYVRAHPEAINALADGRAPDGAPPKLGALFSATDVMHVVRCEHGGPLSATTIRACCGLEEEPAADPPPQEDTS